MGWLVWWLAGWLHEVLLKDSFIHADLAGAGRPGSGSDRAPMCRLGRALVPRLGAGVDGRH